MERALEVKVRVDRTQWIMKTQGIPDSSVGKESACNAGDPGSIPGLGRSPGKGIGYPFQYSWASLVVQLLKNPPAMWETWIQSLDWEDPLEKGTTTCSSILAWRIPWTIQWQRVRHNWVIFTFTFVVPRDKFKELVQSSYISLAMFTVEIQASIGGLNQTIVFSSENNEATKSEDLRVCSQKWLYWVITRLA